MKGQVSVKKILVVVQLAEAAGMPREALLESIRVPASSLVDPEAWLPQSVWRDVWLAVVRHTGQEGIALHAAARIDRGYFGVIDYVARSSPTMGDAIVHAARYFRLANTQGHLSLTHLDGALQISRHLDGDEGLYLPRQAAEFALATMTRVFRGACARPWDLQAVTFRHPPPADPSPHRQFFRCPVRFSAPLDALVVGDGVLSLPMAAPDERLMSLVARHGEAMLAQLPIRDDPLGRLRRILARELAGGHPGIDPVAAQLGMSRRTLQRHLAAAGVTFRSVCDDMRYALALRYVEAGIPQGEAAFLLGYTEPSAFSRAFRRWTGMTPRAWSRLAPDVRESARAGKTAPVPEL